MIRERRYRRRSDDVGAERPFTAKVVSHLPTLGSTSSKQWVQRLRQYLFDAVSAAQGFLTPCSCAGVD